MSSVGAVASEHERLKGLWCRGVASIEQIERCKVLDARERLQRKLGLLFKVIPLFCIIFSFIGALGGLFVGVFTLELDGAQLTDFVVRHLVKFAQFSIIPALTIVIAVIL